MPNYDYTEPGTYSVALCTREKACLFGQIAGGEVTLSEWGAIVADCWQWLPQGYAYVAADTWVLMPNHTHGIAQLVACADGSCRGGSRTAPTGPTASENRRKTLGRFVGAFKTVSTKRTNEVRGMRGEPVWQRNCYELIIRNEEELGHIREYVAANAARWAQDEESPE